MSRPFEHRRPSDIDRHITAVLLMALAAVLLACAGWIGPKVLNARRLQAERERGRGLYARLLAARPAEVPADMWEHRCGWVWTACGNVFFDPFSRTQLDHLRELNNTFDRALAEPVTAVTPFKMWALVGSSCDRGRHYIRNYGHGLFIGASDSTATGGVCGSLGQVMLDYGHFVPEDR